jgi:hypothetical protein
MKIKLSELKKVVRRVVTEAAKDGDIQKIYRRSFARMIDKASTGGNKNTPPFTEPALRPGKSGPPGDK